MTVHTATILVVTLLASFVLGQNKCPITFSCTENPQQPFPGGAAEANQYKFETVPLDDADNLDETKEVTLRSPPQNRVLNARTTSLEEREARAEAVEDYKLHLKTLKSSSPLGIRLILFRVH